MWRGIRVKNFYRGIRIRYIIKELEIYNYRRKEVSVRRVLCMLGVRIEVFYESRGSKGLEMVF